MTMAPNDGEGLYTYTDGGYTYTYPRRHSSGGSPASATVLVVVLIVFFVVATLRVFFALRRRITGQGPGGCGPPRPGDGGC
ncbi:hypothetical protein ACP4OV_002127 [Aristida adscensionis]